MGINPEQQSNKQSAGHHVLLSWFVPWTAGWMFTVGYMGLDKTLAMLQDMNVIEQVFTGLLLFAAWPIFLGNSIAGRGL